MSNGPPQSDNGSLSHVTNLSKLLCIPTSFYTKSQQTLNPKPYTLNPESYIQHQPQPHRSCHQDGARSTDSPESHRLRTLRTRRVQGLGLWGLQLGMLPLMYQSLIGILVPPIGIPIKGCQYKGEHPKLQLLTTKGDRKRVTTRAISIRAKETIDNYANASTNTHAHSYIHTTF